MPHHKSTSENIVVMHSLFSWSKPLPVYFYLLLFCGLVVANVYLYETIFALPVLEVSVRIAGKGNVTIVRTPHHKTLLIDTGSDASILRALGEVLPPWQRDIDAVVLTGDKSLYTGGLPTIESRYRIPDPLLVGGIAAPYGSRLAFDTTTLIIVIAPGIFTISYGATTFNISSSTPSGVYRSSGETITH